MITILLYIYLYTIYTSIVFDISLAGEGGAIFDSSHT